MRRKKQEVETFFFFPLSRGRKNEFFFCGEGNSIFFSSHLSSADSAAVMASLIAVHMLIDRSAVSEDESRGSTAEEAVAAEERERRRDDEDDENAERHRLSVIIFVALPSFCSRCVSIRLLSCPSRDQGSIYR